MKHFPRVLHYLGPYWRLGVCSVFIITACGLVSLLAPWPLKILVDSVLGDMPPPAVVTRLWGGRAGSDMALLGLVVAATLFVTLTANGLSVLENYVNTRIDLGMGLDFRGDLFQHAQRLSLAFHDQSRSGMLIYAVNFQADAAARLVMTVPPLAQSFITLLGMFWITFRIDPMLALLSLTVVPFLYYSVGYYVKHIQGRLTEVKVMEGETLSIIHEAMSMLRVIVAFGREGHEHRRFLRQGARAKDARVALTVRQTLFSLAVNMTTSAGTALVLGFGAYQVLRNRLTVGQLLVVMTYIAGVYKPLETISTTVGVLQDQLISLRMAFELLDTDPEIKDAPGARELPRPRGRVTFESVHFSYTGRVETLKDISFEAQPGQVVALVGPTGAGKTTLVSLLPRFYDASSGRILIDGQPVGEFTLKSLRQQISFVMQEPLLFSCSIADNIRYGRLDASTEEIIAAARAAGAHEFIMNLPDGYDTLIGERGAQLSGGERQRVSIARAFLRDAPILILDEPTSAIDSKTESVILDALERLMAGRTTFIVAHRLSTVRHADLILLMNCGQIAERGTHDELLLRGGVYRQLHDIQTTQPTRRTRPAVAAGANDVSPSYT